MISSPLTTSRNDIVTIPASDHSTTTDESGLFTLTDLAAREPVELAAWAPGHYIVGLPDVAPGTLGVELVLARHTETDNRDYHWLSAFAASGSEEACQHCHSDESGLLPFDEWERDAHGTAARNPRFLSVYTGTSLEGGA